MFENISNDQLLSKNIVRLYVQDILFNRNIENEMSSFPGFIGLESESFSYKISDGNKPIVTSFRDVITKIFEKNAKKFDWQLIYADQNKKDLLLKINLKSGDNLTFEPGGQIEISTKPYPCLKMANDSLNNIILNLRNIFLNENVYLMSSGINPWFDYDEIGLQINKKRYIAMDNYFYQISNYGKNMMRQTCAFQVNLNIGNSLDILSKRFVVSNLLAPFSTAIFANSPIVKNKITKYKSNRSFFWQNIDKKRTGILNLKKDDFDIDDCIDIYCDFVMHAPVGFIDKLNYKIFSPNFSLKDWIENSNNLPNPCVYDLKEHLSRLFPEVRMKGFIEIRSIDAQHYIWQIVPAMFYIGLLYHDKTLDRSLELLIPLKKNIENLYKKSVFGLEDDIIFENSKKLMEISIAGLKSLPRYYIDDDMIKKFLAFQNHFTFQRKTPADDHIDQFNLILNNKDNVNVFDNLEKLWTKVIDG